MSLLSGAECSGLPGRRATACPAAAAGVWSRGLGLGTMFTSLPVAQVPACLICALSDHPALSFSIYQPGYHPHLLIPLCSIPLIFKMG